MFGIVHSFPQASLTIIDHQEIFWKIYFDDLCFDARLIELVIVLELTILYGLPRWQWNSEFYLVSLFIFIIKFVWSILLGWWITFFVYYGIFGGGGVALINVSKELDKLHATCNRWCQSLEFSFYRMLLRCLSLFFFFYLKSLFHFLFFANLAVH